LEETKDKYSHLRKNAREDVRHSEGWARKVLTEFDRAKNVKERIGQAGGRQKVV